MKIAITGIGFVGQALSLVLARNHSVIAFDISKDKVDYINSRGFLKDKFINDYIQNNTLDLKATISPEEAYSNVDVVIIATPTDYNEKTGSFDTTSIINTIELVEKYNTQAIIVIKSTVPIGFSNSLYDGNRRILFCPEFLRENSSLYDCLYPSRIIIGLNLNDDRLLNDAVTIATVLQKSAYKNDVPILYVGYKEAESIKLFSNAYLAMRIGFFNELDTFSELNDLNAQSIIEGVCLDPRIGMFYNNPGFGYGGYCLPKDTKQLIADFKSIPQALVNSIDKANLIRKEHIINQIMSRIRINNKTIIGIYRLTTKSGTTSIRYNCVQYIITELVSKGVSIIIYEPLLNDGLNYYGGTVINDLSEFKRMSELIVANRCDAQIEDVLNKTYCRDIFGKD